MKKRWSKKSMFVPAALIVTSLLGVSAADAENPQCYTVASLQGSYAVVGNYGANLAIALATRYFDGKGSMTGTFLVNEPTAGSTTGARTIVTGKQTGSYIVNCNGTGQITRMLTTTTGVVATQVDDFLITGATTTYFQGSSGWQFVATSIADAVQVPSAIIPGGVFLTRTYTRLPDRPQQ